MMHHFMSLWFSAASSRLPQRQWEMTLPPIGLRNVLSQYRETSSVNIKKREDVFSLSCAHIIYYTLIYMYFHLA